MNGISLLIIEDNDAMRDGMSQILKKAGYSVWEARSGRDGFSILEKQAVDLVITDFKMAETDGIQVLKHVKERFPEVEVIVMTAFATVELAVEAMKGGAWDFVTKPFSQEELKIKMARAAEMIEQRRRAGRLAEENRFWREEEDVRFNYGEIIGESPVMKKVYDTIARVAPGDTSVLIYGETGTGKELLARAVHFHSQRKEWPFIRVNCGALAEGVLESELFGHEKGAFTGAIRRKKGRFELADKGTLFLDEVGDLPLGIQVKLLRVLQEKEFERVGGEETLKADVRLIAATHRNLQEEVRNGRVREDLFYRLHILPVTLPPLRERREDIPLLAAHFLKRLGRELRKPGLSLADSGLEILLAYDWPGNVRELENVLERAVVLSDGNEIDGSGLSFITSGLQGTKIAGSTMNLEAVLASVEKRHLENALKASGGVKSKTARLLGIKEGALYYKLEKYKLSKRGDGG
jgi:two-component system response regulator HydG